MKRGGGSRSEGHADKMVTTRPIGMACQSHPDRNIWAVAREREIDQRAPRRQRERGKAKG